MPQLVSIPSVAGSTEAESCYQRGVWICRIYASLCKYESRVEKRYELGSQSCLSALCIVAARCWWCPLLPPLVVCMERALLSWCTLEADAAAVYQHWATLWHSLGWDAFANWAFWHISLGPHGAQKINFLAGFTAGVFTQVLIMPCTEKDQVDAWRQLSCGSMAQNHLNSTTFVQEAVCSAYQSFFWTIFATKKQTDPN